MILRFFTLTLFFCTLYVSAPSHAFELDLNAIKPLGKLEYLPEAEFNAKTKLIESTPYEDEFLSFRVRMPNGWSENLSTVSAIEKGGPSQRVLGVFSRYNSPPNKHLRSYFTVEAQELTYEIGARNWFINDVVKKGLTLEQVGVESKRQVEAIYIEVKGDITYVVRVKVILNGPRMVVARYYLPQDLYKEEYIQQGQVIRSFELTNREENGVEELKIHGFLNQSFFDYPVSWTISAPLVRSIDRMRAMLYHGRVTDKLDGQVNLYLTNKSVGTTRGKEVAFYKEKFTIDNYNLGKYIESPDLTYHKDMTFGVTESYEMNSTRSNMIDYEFWLSVMESDEYIYVISLLTPARKADFYTWARNVEAYRLIVKGIRREDDGVNNYEFIQ